MKFEDYTPDFWRRLSEARALKSLTQKELAELSGVSQRQISAYESARSWPREAVLIRLAKALGTTPEWLAVGIGNGKVKSLISSAEISRRIPILDSDQLFEWLTSIGNEGVSPRVHPVNYHVSDLAFAMICNDDAMAASDDFGFGFPKGCLVVFEPTIDVDDQDFVLALMKNGSVSFRQFFSGLRTSRLHALDSRYPDEEVSAKEIETQEITLICAIAMENKLPASSRIEVSSMAMQVVIPVEYESPDAMYERSKGKSKKPT